MIKRRMGNITVSYYPGFGDTVVTNFILVLAIGFIPALVLSWFFELTPAGLKRDSDNTAQQFD